MNYTSTRDDSKNLTSSEAISKGLSSDGGLFVPREFPEIALSDISELSKMGYRERAAFILGKYLTDFTEEEIKACMSAAYNTENFETEKIAPVTKLDDNKFVLELWHGPTCAFKDMALQILPHLLTKSAKKAGVKEDVAILVATSGDTGKAALDGFCDVEGTKIIVFFPENGVSRIQKLQMVTQEGKNVYVSAVNGNFDDAQNGVKKIFTDKEFNEFLKKNNIVLSSANSINWGRLVPQIVYYFSAYADLIAGGNIELGEEINIVVPTGNFGNILASYYAKRMGLPVKKLICASNSNNVLTDFINTGVYDRNRTFYTTISPSMDILISSNLERFIYDVSGKDNEKIIGYMKKLSSEGRYDVGDLKEKISEILFADFCDEAETKKTIADTFQKYSYTVDTHTAVAIGVCNKYMESTGDNTITVIASTASPYKFSASVASAIKGDDALSGLDEFGIIDLLSEISNLPVPKALSELKNKEIRFKAVCEPDGMPKQVGDLLGI
ncbi:MAG: threonine synthase [Clostridia bacterium]|nr:threonine synthase [Clostridia bacterium]